MTGALPFSAVVSVPSVLLRGLGLAGFSLFARSRSRVFCRCICWAIFRDRTRPDQTIHGNRCKGRSTLSAASGGTELGFREGWNNGQSRAKMLTDPLPFLCLLLQVIAEQLFDGTRHCAIIIGPYRNASQREFISISSFAKSFGFRHGLWT